MTGNISLKHKIRFITATSLFDGHDAATHIMRRILQQEGAEVIHLGHNRSAKEVVDAAVQEDVQAIAISSYQGGHVEYFTYILELLEKAGCSHVKVFGGGGGVITKEEIALLEKRGVRKIFSPDDGLKMGLTGMIRYMLKNSDYYASKPYEKSITKKSTYYDIAQLISTIELSQDKENSKYVNAFKKLAPEIDSLGKKSNSFVIGITGTGGAGKSSLIDELILRYKNVFPQKSIAVLSVDPTRKKTGGALLGDRIRFNSAKYDNVFIRSMATRRANLATSRSVSNSLKALSAHNFDLIILETAGIGQSDSEIAELANTSVYVMTPEFGAPTQLEKIAMLDYADVVVINKSDKKGARDALRDVCKTYQRNHNLFDKKPNEMPVFPCTAHRFNDHGTNNLFNHLFNLVEKKSKNPKEWKFSPLKKGTSDHEDIIPNNKRNYLYNITECIRDHHEECEKQAEIADQAWAADIVASNLQSKKLDSHKKSLKKKLSKNARSALKSFKEKSIEYNKKEQSYQVRNKTISVQNKTESLSGLDIEKVSLPKTKSWGEQIKYSFLENTPGSFPFTAGVFPFKRQNEDPIRMFAGEGIPERTNKRFHLLSEGQPAHRLSTAFDSVTLYGENFHSLGFFDFFSTRLKR